MESTSINLLRRLQMRDTRNGSDWERFVDLYAPLVYHRGRKQGLDADEAADLVQDVLMVLVTKLPEFQIDPSRRFRAWLRTVTLNRANDLHRKRGHRPISSQDETVQTAHATEGDLFEEEEYRTFLFNRALVLLKSEFRTEQWQAVWQHVVEARPAVEVARDLGITVNMVYLAKSRVLSRMREELGELIE